MSDVWNAAGSGDLERLQRLLTEDPSKLNEYDVSSAPAHPTAQPLAPLTHPRRPPPPPAPADGASQKDERTPLF